jgi:competence protein ComEA
VRWPSRARDLYADPAQLRGKSNKETLMVNARHLIACAVLLVAGATYAADPVNINTADAEALAAAINGVGVKKARDIVTYRQKHGPFESVDELAQVSGIGMQTVDRSRENLTVTTSSK